MCRGEEGELTLLLQPKVCPWARDAGGKAKVNRIGFPLVPEFGGTVHAYCGTELDATQSDLLEWSRRPTMEDMQRAYINESRVRSAEGLLIVQPYSPELFRQGQLPGPRILTAVLRNTLTLSQAKEAWAQAEESKEARAAQRQDWPWSMELPCRTCTLKNDGEEVRKPLKSFAVQQPVKQLWNYIAQGQDLECIRCFQKRRRKEEVCSVMVCSTCEKVYGSAAFDADAQVRWSGDTEQEVQCKSCVSQEADLGRFQLPLLQCQRCRYDWPENCFTRANLEESRDLGKMHLVCCATCQLPDNGQYADCTETCIQ